MKTRHRQLDAEALGDIARRIEQVEVLADKLPV
jgi:hypothetical protein